MLVYLFAVLGCLVLVVGALVAYHKIPSRGRHALRSERESGHESPPRERPKPRTFEYPPARGDLFGEIPGYSNSIENRPFVLEVWRTITNDPEQTIELAPLDWGDDQDGEEFCSASALVAA
jgi:hypothetical protein